MTLRHIDPRSTDWMDAMLEGEPARKSARALARVEAATEADMETVGEGMALAAPPGQALSTERGSAPSASGP